MIESLDTEVPSLELRRDDCEVGVGLVEVADQGRHDRRVALHGDGAGGQLILKCDATADELNKLRFDGWTACWSAWSPNGNDVASAPLAVATALVASWVGVAIGLVLSVRLGRVRDRTCDLLSPVGRVPPPLRVTAIARSIPATEVVPE
jgi:hypothetical protein